MRTTHHRTPEVWTRRWVVLGIGLVLTIGLPLLFGHLGTHIALDMVLPGAGLFGVHTAAAILFVVATVLALAAWLRWGTDWTVLVLLAGSMLVTALELRATPGNHGTLGVVAPETRPAAHEFPLVIILVSLLSRLGHILRRLPGVAALQRRRALARDGLASIGALAPVERCRTVSIAVLAGLEDPAERAMLRDEVRRPDVARRARIVGAVARLRFGGDPFRRDHAHARAALTLTDQLDAGSRARFVDDAQRATAGLPCSEPGWLRPLDASLTAAALDHAGHPQAIERLGALFDRHLVQRRGHRAARWWTLLGAPIGPCPPWEHAASTAIAGALGAIDPSTSGDWAALRMRAMGAAARGTSVADDERLIAAARIWLVFVDDAVAAPIVARPTVRHDPLAVALDRLARRLADDPLALRPGQPVGGVR